MGDKSWRGVIVGGRGCLWDTYVRCLRLSRQALHVAVPSLPGYARSLTVEI